VFVTILAPARKSSLPPPAMPEAMPGRKTRAPAPRNIMTTAVRTKLNSWENV